MSTLGEFLHDVADALQFDSEPPSPLRHEVRSLADNVEQDAPAHPSPAWQAFARTLERERDKAQDARRREMLARLLGSLRKLSP